VNAVNVPSPPSAIGQQSTTVPGTAFSIPADIAAAAAAAVIDPLKLSGAQMIFTGRVYRADLPAVLEYSWRIPCHNIPS
jgi:hypothetical protein